jgi:hypothetical protein
MKGTVCRGHTKALLFSWLIAVTNFTLPASQAGSDLRQQVQHSFPPCLSECIGRDIARVHGRLKHCINPFTEWLFLITADCCCLAGVCLRSWRAKWQRS